MTATTEASSGEGNRRAWSGWSNFTVPSNSPARSRILGIALFGPCLVLIAAHVLFVLYRHRPHGGSIRPFEQTVQEGEAAISQDNQKQSEGRRWGLDAVQSEGEEVQGTLPPTRSL